MQISFDRKTVNECLQQKFVLPTYQRDYKWEPKHLQELLGDIKEAFFASRKPNDGRTDVLAYDPYFLGTIIATPAEQGGKAIVDGQQRITTLAIILCYAHRIALQRPELNISPVDATLRRRIAGQSAFNLDLTPDRLALFTLLMDGPVDMEELSAKVDSIENIDPGSLQLWKVFQHIEPELAGDIAEEKLLGPFFDYVTECVYLFEIGVPSEQDGHKVFVTMNDRGLRLSPIDLLKGFLLSSIPNDAANREAHAVWTNVVKQLKDLGTDEDSSFFKAWFRAKYGETIRGKKRGDAPGDFEIIGESYHRWVMDHKEQLKLLTSDDFSNLITKELPFYAKLYSQLKVSEQSYSADQPFAFFNGSRNLTMQAMVIMGAVTSNDSSQVVARKVKAVSAYLDYLATVRLLNGKDNSYDNVRDLMFELTKQIRNLDSNKLEEALKERVNTDKDSVSGLSSVSYQNLNRKDLLHLLARLAHELEQSLELSTAVSFAAYVDRTRANQTFDVEHLLTDSMEKVNNDLTASGGAPFNNEEEFKARRDAIGALILLPRGRNRSMQDLSYSEKLTRYASENVLAQTLTNGFFQNQPN